MQFQLIPAIPYQITAKPAKVGLISFNKQIIRLEDLEDMFPRYSINQMDNAMKRLLNL